jgi:transposase-like protein
LGGRPKALPAEKRQWAVQLYEEKKIAVKHICALMGISKPTLYAYVRQAQEARQTRWHAARHKQGQKIRQFTAIGQPL